MSEKTEELDGIIPFELIVGDAGGQIDNGDVPIRWCASPTFIKELEAKNVIDPHVLIASYSPRGRDGKFLREMDRKLLPLGELMTYLRFTKAGKCKIYGLLLDGRDGRASLHTKWMRASYGNRDEFVNSWDDDVYENNDYEVANTSEVVDIPEGVFGKEPSPWVKWYVNLWHNTNDKITDECDFRKRFLIAFIFKWMVVLPYVSILVFMRVLVTGSLALAGYFKEVEFLRSFRPYKYPSFQYNLTDGGVDVINDNFFLFKRKDFSSNKKDKKTTMISGIVISPLSLLIISLIILIGADVDGIVGFSAILFGTVITLCLILAMIDIFIVLIELLIRIKINDKLDSGVFALLAAIVRGLGKFGGYFASLKISSTTAKLIAFGFIGVVILMIFGAGAAILIGIVGAGVVFGAMAFGFSFLLLLFSNKILDWIEKYSALSAKNNDYANITELLCPKEEDNLRPNYKYIPKKQRTVRLWYRDLKNKVCKPMQT